MHKRQCFFKEQAIYLLFYLYNIGNHCVWTDWHLFTPVDDVCFDSHRGSRKNRSAGFLGAMETYCFAWYRCHNSDQDIWNALNTSTAAPPLRFPALCCQTIQHFHFKQREVFNARATIIPSISNRDMNRISYLLYCTHYRFWELKILNSIIHLLVCQQFDTSFNFLYVWQFPSRHVFLGTIVTWVQFGFNHVNYLQSGY